ncbi:MAG: endonuclease/exonuclease/phosphatase [Parcubacteria group bacterium Greene0714_36]|nr:MAG: endonuclease/exonuclease/phosphatase [Parcubacteria group bacterium Greene0714_36]
MPIRTLRLISFNIFYALRHGRLARSVFDHFKKLGPDVICLQEVLIGKKRNFARGLADALDMHLSFSLRREYGTRQIGLAVLSRAPAEENTAVILPRSPAKRPRIVQIVQIAHKGVVWRIANTHLSAVSSAARKEQIMAILASLNSRPTPTPLILAGDFNTKTQKEVAQFGAALRDAGFAAPETLPYSWRLFGAKRQFDWITAQHAEIPAIETVPHIRGSDHTPVWADITYTPS